MKHKNLLKAGLVLMMALALLPVQPAYADTIIVDTTSDALDAADSCSEVTIALLPGTDGVISLREAICAANNHSGPDTIEFDIAGCGGGVCTIQPTSALPALTDDDTAIDGYTQDGAVQATDTTSATLTVEIDGTNAGVAISGLTVNSDDNTLRGLVIRNFDYFGIRIGLNAATGNTVAGNHIGTDVNGATAQGNGESGVYLYGGAKNNTIGGDAAAERNVISGNNSSGVRISASGTMSNTVSGNYIGLAADGTSSLGNGDGVYILQANNNTIGGNAAGERNIISGNSYGVLITSGGGGGIVSNNIVSGNYIGTDASGMAVVGNTHSGVYIAEDAQNNIIGGDTVGERNVISGNGWHGVEISWPDTISNTVLGNYIGTDASGMTELGNNMAGVYITDGAHNNTIGGDAAGERNIISGNDDHGVWILGSDTMSNTISGNYIGTDVNGTTELGNGEFGVYISDGAQDNTVGPDNVIAHNVSNGVGVDGSSTSGNIITQNSIFSNTNGIYLWDGANGGIAAPVIITTTQGSVYIVGTACAGCTVEVFENGDTDGEGETYVGDTTADGSGAFTVTVSSLPQPYLTATATDATSGTSEFSGVFTATVELTPGSGPVYLPIIMRNY